MAHLPARPRQGRRWMRHPKKSNPSFDVTDPRLGFRQAQAHRGKYRADLVAERFGVVAGAVDHDHEVVRVSDEPHGRFPGAAALGASPFRAERFPLRGEVLVQHGQSDVGQQR